MILVTGGAGFLGRALIPRLEGPVRAFSRNEGQLIRLKQDYPDVEIVPGDITNHHTVKQALLGVDVVYHLAAMKHIGMAESYPLQCAEVNILGSINLLKSFHGKLFVAISTDKAAQVSGVYGATKFLLEHLVRQFSVTRSHVQYRVIRYGNILYSTGSVLEKWKKAIQGGGKVVMTDPEATRFFWTVDQAVDLIFEAVTAANGSEPYCPTMKAMRMGDLLTAMLEKYGKEKSPLIETIKLQPGENLHEVLVPGGPTSAEVDRYTVKEIKELI